ncbi:histidine phosphatase family protein [Microbacterium ulmi]|uniref:Histidine phosphatase family protein n=1 Tax=Microbacterium ulmi TaxID=179095 RepID=A0A7Y2M0Z3_9MICO|nr:putative phosphoglycerate mutase [Microbacterium ulmi]NNH03789.1 histidine phosphatase family protein [Microbacterium ulmi]
MSRILLVRHAEADGHDEVDPALSPLGVRQAEALAGRLAGENIRQVLTSPRRRARQTADLIARRIGRSATSSDLLEDRTPTPCAPRWNDYPSHRWEWLRDVPDDERDEDGVMLSAAWSRIVEQCSEVGWLSADETLVLVTHAFVVSWFVCRALDAPPAAWMLLPVANASITELAARPHGEYAVVGFNDVGHLVRH